MIYGDLTVLSCWKETLVIGVANDHYIAQVAPRPFRLVQLIGCFQLDFDLPYVYSRNASSWEDRRESVFREVHSSAMPSSRADVVS